jgi:hypothetical protein
MTTSATAKGETEQILDSDRAYLLEMRSLATDAEGREVLVGLNLEETAFYMAHVRDRVALNHKRSADHEEQAERYLSAWAGPTIGRRQPESGELPVPIGNLIRLAREAKSRNASVLTHHKTASFLPYPGMNRGSVQCKLST